MTYPNPIYKTPKILSYLLDLISDYHYDHYYDLSESDKGKLAALLSEAAGQHGEAEFIIESPHFDSAITYFRKALSGTRKDDDKFLEIIKKNAIDYYDLSMEELFNYALSVRDEKLKNYSDNIYDYTPTKHHYKEERK